MITYDKELPSLPDDIINEIFNLLDVKALKSCSLTCKALSHLAKPFVHQALYLTPRSGRWNEFEGLQTLRERGLLQHTRHLSVIPNGPLLARSLDPHIRQLHTLTKPQEPHGSFVGYPFLQSRDGRMFRDVFGDLAILGAGISKRR